MKTDTSDDARASRYRELLENCEHALAFFIDHFPMEHGNEQIGRAWGAIESATSIARELVKAATARGKPVTPSMAGKPWTVELDRQLLSIFDAGHTLQTIADTMGRTLVGTRARLEKLGRLEARPLVNWNASDK